MLRLIVFQRDPDPASHRPIAAPDRTACTTSRIARLVAEETLWSSRSAACVAPWVVWWTLLAERLASLFCAANQPDCCPRSALKTKSGFLPSVVRVLA